jgi:hypothetical protein
MKHRAAALVLVLLILLLALAIFLAPLAADPAAHVELGRIPGDLVGQLHGLSQRWYEYFIHLEPRSERPLITLILRYRDELGLSREQVQTLERLRTDFQRESTRREADLRTAETDLTTLLEADPVDLGQVEAKLRAIERQRADLRLARIQTIEQGKAALTPGQRAKFRSLH